MKIFFAFLSKQRRWELVLVLLVHLLLVGLVGPGILLAYPLQRWASRQPWDAEERWDTLWYFAGVGSLCYLPLMLWHAQFVVVWQQIPWLGSATIASWRFRAFLGFFLIPLAPLILERLAPRTNSALVRVKRPEDRVAQPLVSAAQPDALPGQREKRSMPGSKVPRFLPPLHRPGGSVVVKRDPRPLGEVLLEEKQRRQKLAIPVSAESIPAFAPQKINWDEGEGTYREQ